MPYAEMKEIIDAAFGRNNWRPRLAGSRLLSWLVFWPGPWAGQTLFGIWAATVIKLVGEPGSGGRHPPVGAPFH